MVKRELDGIYFMVNRDGKNEPVCFTDLTDEEIDYITSGRDIEWWITLSLHLRGVIRDIGNMFDLYGVNRDV